MIQIAVKSRMACERVTRLQTHVEIWKFWSTQIWTDTYACLFVCLGFYAISTVFQLFNGNSSQIHVSWTIFNQYRGSDTYAQTHVHQSDVVTIMSRPAQADTTN